MNGDVDEQQQHCTICLQPFLDKTIISVCAHEFCFECILLWSAQSRKCPLCARSYGDAYLIHRIRSQYDYQKHYLPPLRTSPPPLTGESHANALRHTRRERQWGRRQRQQREEADQLERAISRRRWIYQHHLYAKHIASNVYTRYRPFPTPAQFTASPDLISRMTIFLRRELRVWPNLDVEFLTTYTIALMKSIDIRSESAVKLLSEFLDLDSPYTPGARRANAEHFVHEIYSYLRSPYRDLNTYDSTAQYDTPPEIAPPQEIESGNRWDTVPSPSRRSRSRSRPPSLRNGAERRAREEARREGRPSHRQSRRRSPGDISSDQEDPFDARHSPLRDTQDALRNNRSQSREATLVLLSNSPSMAEGQLIGSSAQHHIQDNQKDVGQLTEFNESIPVADVRKNTSVPRGGDMAVVGELNIVRRPLSGADDDESHYVDNTPGDSSANTMLSRKRSAGQEVHPRRRTLSAGVEAHLDRRSAPRHTARQQHRRSQNGRAGGASDANARGIRTTLTRPTLLSRLTDGPTEAVLGKDGA